MRYSYTYRKHGGDVQFLGLPGTCPGILYNQLTYSMFVYNSYNWLVQESWSIKNKDTGDEIDMYTCGIVKIWLNNNSIKCLQFPFNQF